jgi:hypothetical protein
MSVIAWAPVYRIGDLAVTFTRQLDLSSYPESPLRKRGQNENLIYKDGDRLRGAASPG